MNQKNTHLLTLIKLLEGRLSDAEGVAVREQMAADSVLLQRWKMLSRIYEQQASPDNASGNDVPDAESVAAFVEERMNADESAVFELNCWRNTATLREVISTWQAAYVDTASHSDNQQDAQYVAQVSQRMREFALGQCPPVESAQSADRYFQKIEDRFQPNLNSTTRDSSEAEAGFSEQLSGSGISPPRSIRDSRRKAQLQRWIYAAGAVIVIGFPVYFAFFYNAENRSITKNPEAGSPRPIPKIPGSETEQPVNDAAVPELAVVPETKKTIPPPQPLPRTIPVTPAMDKKNNEPPVVAKKGPTVEAVSNLDLQISWTRLSGIIGSRSDATSPWKGILAGAPTSRIEIDTEQKLELRTLPFSWLQGKIQSGSGGSGPELVLDADSEIQITLRGVKNQDETKPGHHTSASLQTIIDLDLITGKVAISDLQSGDVLKFQDQRQEWLLQVKQAGTSVGFIQLDENRREIMAFSGEVHVSSTTSEQEISLQAAQMLVMKDQNIGAPVRITRKQRWRTDPPPALKFSKSYLEQMNQSDDLLAALLSAPPGKTGLELLASTNLGFVLDPVASVPQAAYSSSEVQRTAAIEWLVAAKEKPAARAVWSKIDAAGNTGSAAPSIRTWFNVAQGKVPLNQQILAELFTGLGAAQPLFVRQCSIHFLRQLSRQRLAEYDANQPSQAAINSVLQKVRRATVNTRPTGNNNQRRN
tara:strand:+ start:35428 stop:37533 length:2106 start_codon:yes stop_codon:yes gene_type:complete